MFDRLAAADPEAGARARARAARHVAGPLTDFSSNRTIQVSVLAVTLGWREVVESHGLHSDASAGLSLGEYAHLVDGGALEPEDALALVAERGALYDAGPRGAMAALFPVTWEDLAPLLARVAEAQGGPSALAPAVFNSPTQVVVGGSRAAVEALIELAADELVAHGVVIEDRVPMHTPRLAPVALRFREALQRAPWTGQARVPYLPNVTAELCAPDPDTLVDRLARHVEAPVLWRQTVDALAAEHPQAVFLEVGPRTVLRDLMSRRWHSRREVFAVDSPDAPLDSVSALAEATLAEVRRRTDGGGASPAPGAAATPAAAPTLHVRAASPPPSPPA
jgi:[acyl-carrier-protein] S-malonyltransferase